MRGAPLANDGHRCVSAGALARIQPLFYAKGRRSVEADGTRKSHAAKLRDEASALQKGTNARGASGFPLGGGLCSLTFYAAGVRLSRRRHSRCSFKYENAPGRGAFFCRMLR